MWALPEHFELLVYSPELLGALLLRLDPMAQWNLKVPALINLWVRLEPKTALTILWGVCVENTVIKKFRPHWKFVLRKWLRTARCRPQMVKYPVDLFAGLASLTSLENFFNDLDSSSAYQSKSLFLGFPLPTFQRHLLYLLYFHFWIFTFGFANEVVVPSTIWSE